MAAALASCASGPPEPRGFTIREEHLVMADGVSLAATVFLPEGAGPNAKVGSLFEMIPYRKDDAFYQRDYPLYAYFARRGVAGVKVDVRGTGGSAGTLPDREYSAREIDDAVEVIRQLAAAPWSDGRVVMWGISWGGFNALQTGMRSPPGLSGVLALHASDDLYHDDIHFIDGCFHVDGYQLEIDQQNGLPRSPDYTLDDAYVRDRFDREPWIFAYVERQRDGAWWREGSLRYRPDAVVVPVHLIGGLLDGYRDTVPRLLAALKPPVTAAIGPWTHDWPDNGTPGPRYEWRDEAVRFVADPRSTLDRARLLIFVRAGHEPDAVLADTPGAWRSTEWPIPEATVRTLFPAPRGRLVEGLASSETGRDRLRYAPGAGTAAGTWWGEPTGDMAGDDAASLAYDTEPLTTPLVLAGMPRVRLRVAASASLAHWIVRLEDVAPDGRVALVTGGAVNGAQRRSRTDPETLVPGRFEDLALDLHMTTWTLRPGHRLRLAVSNAQFPMIWPTPYSMETRMEVGTAATALELPVVPSDLGSSVQLPIPEPREERPDAADLPARGWPFATRVARDPLTGRTTFEQEYESAWSIRDRRFRSWQRVTWDVRDDAPEDAGFTGSATDVVDLPGRSLKLTTSMRVRSDRALFHVEVTRRISENGSIFREKTWSRAIPRDHQ